MSPQFPWRWMSRLYENCWHWGLLRIDRLESKQVERLAEYRERWLQITLAAGPTDRHRAEAAIDEVYRRVDVPPARLKLWLNNPLEGCIGAFLVMRLCDYARRLGAVGQQTLVPWEDAWGLVKAEVRLSLGEAAWTETWERVWGAIHQQVTETNPTLTVQPGLDPIWQNVEGAIWGRVKTRFKVKVWLDENHTGACEVDPAVISQIREAVSEPVAEQARDQFVALTHAEVMSQLEALYLATHPANPGVEADDPFLLSTDPYRFPADPEWAPLVDALEKASSGAHKCYNQAFFSYLHEVCGLPMDILNGVWQAAADCGWYWRFLGVVILIPKPQRLELVNGRLHAVGRPAVQYADGFGVYALQGLRLPQTYGRLMSEQFQGQWQASWLLASNDPGFQLQLLRTLGLSRVLEELAGQIAQRKPLSGGGEVLQIQLYRHQPEVRPLFWPATWLVETDPHGEPTAITWLPPEG